MTTASSDGVNPLAVDPATGVSLPTAPPPPPPAEPSDADEPSALNQPSALDQPASDLTQPFELYQTTDEPTVPPVITDVTPGPGSGALGVTASNAPPAPDDSTQDEADRPMEASESDPPSIVTSMVDINDTNDLLALKQQALEQLSPLVDQLDQTPEERFRTTMMLIQSTDDPSRIPEAYKSAQAITDEKVRAQALLDVVNEINYFTQKPSATTDQSEEPTSASTL